MFATRWMRVGAKSASENASLQTASKVEGKRPFEGGICTSITAPTLDEARRQLTRAKQLAVDSVEFRLDFLEDFQPTRDLKKLLSDVDIPYIVTYRPTWEG